MAALGDHAGPSQANDWRSRAACWTPVMQVGDTSALKVRPSRPDPLVLLSHPPFLSSLDHEGPKGAEWGQRA